MPQLHHFASYAFRSKNSWLGSGGGVNLRKRYRLLGPDPRPVRPASAVAALPYEVPSPIVRSYLRLDINGRLGHERLPPMRVHYL